MTLNAAACTFDWVLFSQVMTGLGGLSAGCSAIALAIFAKRGLSTWRDQLRGTSQLQLASDCLASCHQAAEALRYMLGNDPLPAEISSVEKSEDEDPNEWRERAELNVAVIRYEKHKSVFDELRSLSFKAKVSLPEDAYSAIRTMLSFPHDIANTANTINYLRYLQREAMTNGSLEKTGRLNARIS